MHTTEDAKYTYRDVTIITVTYNSAHCLDRLWVDLRDDQPFIIVDNHSDDDTVTTAKRLLPHTTILINADNLGFGAANNRALAQVTTPYVLLLNPDCECNNAILDALLTRIQSQPDAAVIAPALVKNTQSLSASSAATLEPYAVDFVTGAAMLFNMAVMRDIGFFDETFFLYYEDTDLCKRIHNANKPMIIDPNIQLVHRSRGSVKGNRPLRDEFFRGFYHAQAKIIFSHKHDGLPNAKRLYYKVLTLAIIGFPFRCLVPVPKHVARLAGRIVGLLQYQFADNNTLRMT